MKYMLVKDSKQTGPYSSEQIGEMLKCGEAKTTDKVLFEGVTEWVPISSVFEFRDLMVPADNEPMPAIQPQKAKYCIKCGTELPIGSSTCPNCNIAAANIASTTLTRPNKAKITYTSYSEVPWYRRNLFVCISFLFCSPICIIILLTGDAYYMKKGELMTYSTAAKIFLIAFWVLLVFLKIFTSSAS